MEYYKIPAKLLGVNAKIPIVKMKSSDEVFYELASQMLNEIKHKNEIGESTVFICPVGPVGHYPIFVDLVNKEKISLKNVWFFNMDEYLDENKEWISEDNKLSFRGFMNREVYSKIDESFIMPKEQRIFPDPKDIHKIDKLISSLGGVDICIGGIGINGHIAFNEPNSNLSVSQFAELGTRVLKISEETLVTNAIGDLGGAIEIMPRYCITIGMKQIFSAKKIILAVFRDWHRAVCRRAVYGEVSSAFPVSILQNHENTKILVNDIASNVAIM